MTDFTNQVQKPGLGGAAPTYNVCTATDKFAALPNSKYLLHYKNGATAQASGAVGNTITDSTTPTPPGSAPAAGFADVVTLAGPGMLATTEYVSYIDNSNRFRDNLGFINLKHPGTLTTVTVAIIGPL